MTTIILKKAIFALVFLCGITNQTVRGNTMAAVNAPKIVLYANAQVNLALKIFIAETLDHGRVNEAVCFPEKQWLKNLNTALS
jgi:hypothetical protein